ncbi:MAG TPA: organic hydroperoxide resistance protein [Bacillota bacterium]
MGKVLFSTKATSQNGPAGGYVKSEDELIDLKLVNPLMKSKEVGSNPEQLFAAGYSSCFDGALNFVAMKKKIKVKSETTAEVSFLKDPEDQGYKMGVTLHVKVKGVSNDEAEQLLEAAHQFCPFSKAIEGNVDVKINPQIEA